jgi:HEAT repeat protein
MLDKTYERMRKCFTCSDGELADLAADTDWQVRYAAAVAIGARGDAMYLPMLERMLDIEDERPLYTQPEPEYIGTSGDSSLAELVKPFQVVFPHPVDADTLEAWKCRGRVKQAVLFAIHAIGTANDSLIRRMTAYVEDDIQDASVKCAAVRALGRVGGARVRPLMERMRNHPDITIRMEADKAIEVLNHE